MPRLAFAVVPAPWGPVHLAASGTAVVAIQHLASGSAFTAEMERRHRADARPPTAAARRLVDDAADQVAAYLAGRRRSFELPVDVDRLAGWDRVVLAAVEAVPWGTATSYGRLARRIGRAGAARAVGGAVGRNPIGIVIPCHRVLAGDGSLGGFGGGAWGERDALLEVKRELLRLEGIGLPAERLLD